MAGDLSLQYLGVTVQHNNTITPANIYVRLTIISVAENLIILPESAAWNTLCAVLVLLHFDAKLCLQRTRSTCPCVLLNGYLENSCATSMPGAKRWCSQLRRKPIRVRPITLAIATCQIEQIEFVFLRWLVGALNSALVALLIKAVKANLFSCEPRRLGSGSG